MDYTCISFVLRGILLLGSFSAILRITHQLPLAILGIALFSLAVLFLFDWPAARRLTGFKLHFSLKCSALLLVECVPLMCNSLLQTAVVSIPRTALESLYGNYTLGDLMPRSPPGHHCAIRRYLALHPDHHRIHPKLY